MKLECPYCWQHYDLESGDTDREIQCVSCGQVFSVRNALKAANKPSRRPLILTAGGILVAVLVLAGVLAVLRPSDNLARRNRQEIRQLKNQLQDLSRRVEELEKRKPASDPVK